MIYYFLPLISFFAAILNTDKRRNQIFSGLVFSLIIIIVLIGAFRGEGIGSDYYSYQEIYKGQSKVEPAFECLISISKVLSNSFNFFLGIAFIIAFSIKFIAFKKLSPFLFISLMIYLGFWFLVYDINGIRQGIALSFTALSVVYLNNQNNKQFYVLTIFSTLLHYSAILFIPLALISKLKCKRKLSIIIVAASYIIAFIGVFDFVVDKLFSLNGVNYLAAKIISYSLDDNYNGNILLSFSTFHRILIYMIIIYTIPKVKISDSLKNILLWCATLGIAIYFMFSSIEIIATRLSLYYRFMECISLACIPTLFHKKCNRYLCFVILLLYVELQVVQTLNIPHGNLLPYSNLMF